MKICYRPEQNRSATWTASARDAGKPAEVVESWLRLDPAAVVIGFEPLTRADLALAHDRAYVDAVLDLKRCNGFGNRSPEIANTLPYTTGSFYAAAHHAWTSKESAASPTSGFHHAGYDDSFGFCTFNGLMIAAQKLNLLGAKSVGILIWTAITGTGRTISSLAWASATSSITPSAAKGSMKKRPSNGCKNCRASSPASASARSCCIKPAPIHTLTIRWAGCSRRNKCMIAIRSCSQP